MLFWLFVIVAVVCLALTFFDKFDDFCGYLVVLGRSSAFLSVIMLLIIAISHAKASGNLAVYQHRYELLAYQYASNMYDNDVGLRSLMEDIQDYNEEVVLGKAHQRDLWFGIFVPDFYDQLEIIKIEKE